MAGGALAGSVTVGSSSLSEPVRSVELDEASRTNADVQQAIKSFEKRDIDQCIQQLTKAHKAHPDLPPPHALLAKLAFMSNQGNLIRPALERAVSEDAGHPEVFILFGNLALVENRLTDAAVHFEKATSLAAAKRWSAEQRNRFEHLCDQGTATVFENRGDWKAARAALERWLKQEPANARARQRLGKVLFRIGEYKAAHAELERACKEDKNLEPAAMTMGWLYTRSGNLKKAEEWMDYGVKIAPESLAAHSGMAAWLLEQGRGDEAQSHVDAVLKSNPASGEINRLVGLAARQRKDLARAEKVFQAMTDESPADAWARNQLAIVLAEQNDPAKQTRAVELAELSARQDPKAADSLATLGTVYYRLGRLDDAEKLLAAVFQNGQCRSDDVLALARVEAAQGKKEVVVPLLKKALAASGLFLERNEAKRWLEDLENAKKK